MPSSSWSTLALAACGGGDDASAGNAGAGGKLALVAYSTPGEAYEELIAAFRDTTAGQGVSFDQSYGSSGEQSRAVEAGLPADVVAFSLVPDVTRLVEAGLIDYAWNQDAYAGMVTNSVVVLAVREGNPKHIDGWDDLLRDDVEVITPNPFTSGGARWNIMAAYGAQLELGKSEDEAIDFLRAGSSRSASRATCTSIRQNEFVMSFVGPVTRLGDAWIRPHDVELALEPNGATREAMVERVVHLGFEVRAELVLDDGRRLSAQLTRDQADELELRRNQIVFVRPTRTTTFSATATPPGSE